jgi:Rab GTPase-binding effector protein 1
MSRSSGSLSNHSQLSQENETLEEDMRKAKESAELLRSVVLPLEEEISNLKKNLELSKKKNLEYEQHLLGNVS